jgi:hypothetical protein
MTIDTRQQLLNQINSQIALNGTGAITGPVLNTTLDTMVNSALFYTGTWSAYTSYAPLDVVIYGGNSYVSLTNNVNVIPASSATNWTPFVTSSASAGGVTGSIQYNNGAGGFAGSSGFTFDGSTLTVNGVSATTLSATGAISAGTSVSATGAASAGTTVTAGTSISSGTTITAGTNLLDQLGDVRSVPISNKTTGYVLASTDNGKVISITTGGVTVPATGFTAGQNVTIFNNSSSSQTITSASGVNLRLAGTATTGNRTLAQYGICTIVCYNAPTDFVITGAGLT